MALPLIIVELTKLAGLAGVVFGVSSCGGMGVDGNSVRIQLQNLGRSCDTDPKFGNFCQFFSALAIAKMRIWSCECVESQNATAHF